MQIFSFIDLKNETCFFLRKIEATFSRIHFCYIINVSKFYSLPSKTVSESFASLSNTLKSEKGCCSNDVSTKAKIFNALLKPIFWRKWMKFGSMIYEMKVREITFSISLLFIYFYYYFHFVKVIELEFLGYSTCYFFGAFVRKTGSDIHFEVFFLQNLVVL